MRLLNGEKVCIGFNINTEQQEKKETQEMIFQLILWKTILQTQKNLLKTPRINQSK